MIDKETFSRIIRGIIWQGKAECSLDDFPPPKEVALRQYYMLANEAAIYYKTALICESQGVAKAIEYYKGSHDEDEYKEFLRVEV